MSDIEKIADSLRDGMRVEQPHRAPSERKAFEAWAREYVVNDDSELEKRSNGAWLEYVDDHIEALYLGWMARAEWVQADREAPVT
jgi:hypothetical protein